jgi:hypothetical protein
MGVLCLRAVALAFDGRVSAHVESFRKGTFNRYFYPIADIAVVGFNGTRAFSGMTVPLDVGPDRTHRDLVAAGAEAAFVSTWSSERCAAVAGPIGRSNVSCVPYDPGAQLFARSCISLHFMTFLTPERERNATSI